MDRFVCYADWRYRGAQDSIVQEAKSEGFDKIYAFREEDIDPLFKEKHKDKFAAMKSAAFVWKPYFIKRVVDESADGDFVYYSDCGDRLKSGIKNYAKGIAAKSGFALVGSRFVNLYWTKYDCFRLMGCEDGKYYNAVHLEAGQIGFIVNDFSRKLIDEWLYYCEDSKILLPGTITKELVKITRHSWDQSVLTNLAAKYGLPTVDFYEYREYVEYNVRDNR